MPREKVEYKCKHKLERDVAHLAGNRTPADEAFIKRMKEEVNCVDCRRKANTARRNEKVKAEKTKAKADKAEKKAKPKPGKAKTKAAAK